MRKVNRYNQEILNQATLHGLNLDNLRKKYKLVFVVKLFKYLKKETKKNSKEIDLIFPKKNSDYNLNPLKYIEKLENAGFKIKTWSEGFIDEDTGEVVDIPRFGFKPLK